MDERTQSTKIPDDAMKLSLSQWENALKSLAKLLGAIRFYPSNHPALKDVTSDLQGSLAPLFQAGESASVVVRRTGFYCEEEQIGVGNAVLQKLAASLFSRKIQRLTILREVSNRDLWETAKILLLDLNLLQASGGVQALLQKAGVTTVGVNSVDMKGLFVLRGGADEERDLYGKMSEPPAEELSEVVAEELVVEGEEVEEIVEASAELPESREVTKEITFEELLQSLQTVSSDEDFVPLLLQLVSLLQTNLNEESAHLVLAALSFLAQYREGHPDKSESARAVERALAEIASSPVVDYYIDLLIARVRRDLSGADWEKINTSLGAPLARRLLILLADEDDPSVRKIFIEALVSQGQVSFDVIIASLQEDRWATLRTATSLLGELRNPAAIDPLRPLLVHRDLHVRREALRALTRIGGNSVIAILAKVLFGSDGELRRQAMLCLGAIKNPSTVPLLVQFLEIRDLRFLLLEAKIDAVKALGEIASPDALQVLYAIVRNRSFFYRRSNDELRSAALLAIGEIGGKDAIAFLESMKDTDNHLLGRAVVNALKQARKGQRRD